jgi:lipid A disaccharide synthetase
VNLLAEEEVFPEFVHHKCQGKNMAKVCLDWLAHPEKIDALQQKLALLRQKWAIPGATARAAKLLVDRIINRSEAIKP